MPLDPVSPASAGTPSWSPWPTALHDARHSGASSDDGPVNGTVRWRRRFEGPVTPGPVLARDGTIYVASNAGVLHALDPATGADRWTVDAGTNGNREWAYRPDGSLRWTFPRIITYSSPSVTSDGMAYVADHSGRVHVLRVSDGTEAAAYQDEPPPQIWSAVAVDRGHRIYFGTQDGQLLGVAPNGSVLDVALGGPVDSYPALTADGTVVIGDRSGEVVAVG